MNTDELIQIAQKIIGDRLQLDYFSKISGTVIFRQSLHNITEAEIGNIQMALLANGIYVQVQRTNHEYLLRIFSEFSRTRRANPRINILLFLVTVLTTSLTGTMLAGYDPFLDFGNIIHGLPFSFGILAILSAHEFGHYYYAIKNKIFATLPYFIPFFVPGFSFGTLGAFIKVKSPIPDRRALFDMGIAGPLAGWIVSLLFLVYGFANLPDRQGVIEYVSRIHEWSDGAGALTLGNNLLFTFMRTIMDAEHLPMHEVYHFPFIFAGWAGLLVTALNLMPIGQLDGGHISYAMFGKRARAVAVGAFIAIAVLNVFNINWILWTILILIVVRLKHPPTMNDSIQIDDNRRALGWFSYIIFITCFSPFPVYFA